ncbi:hypothetical protein HYV81_04400 [Candidatus Woesearchaeota archaeon]|nr:hypothetical protein [Candidatus Woesearchaeota archaeon]
MVDWNVIRYITDKIGQGEQPAAIKQQLVANGYDMKLINESFTQAIPWLKQEDADKIKAMQAADKPVVQPPAQPAQSAQQAPKPVEQSTQPQSAPNPQPVAEPTVSQTVQGQEEPKQKLKIKKSWVYTSIAAVVIAIVALYALLR